MDADTTTGTTHAEAFEDVAGDGTSNFFGGPPPQEEDLPDAEPVEQCQTWSGIPIKPLYTADDVPARSRAAPSAPPSARPGRAGRR